MERKCILLKRAPTMMNTSAASGTLLYVLASILTGLVKCLNAYMSRRARVGGKGGRFHRYEAQTLVIVTSR